MGASIPNPWGTFSPISSGKIVSAMKGMSIGVFRLPTDPLGYVTATFDGVHAGSEIRIFSLAGVERAGIESCDADHVLTWGVYGSPDTVIVRIVHVAYKIKEFNLRVSKGSATIPVQQELDPWYSNP